MAIAYRKSPQFGVSGAVLLSFILLLIACHNPLNKDSDQSKSPPGQSDRKNIPPFLRLSGSNTIGAELGPALVEAWLAQKKGATEIRRQPGGKEDEVRIFAMIGGQLKMVEVKAHGTATGFTDLENGSCDIAMASRKIKNEEQVRLASLNLGDEKVIGLDAVVVILHESNGVTAMTKQEVNSIFTGENTSRTWHVNARDDKSGTFDTFKDRVLGSAKLVGSAKRYEDSRALASAVAADPDGIGFVGLPFAVGVKKLQIQEKGALPVEPTVLTVRNESYPLTRRLLFYVPQQASSDARQFADFVISDAGQDIVDKIGFVGQNLMIINPDPNRAPETKIPGADILNTMLYFRSGSSELDARAVQDLQKLVNLLSKQEARRGIILVGFADNKGTVDANLRLSRDRAQTVANRLAPLGIVARGVTGFGQALPLADNSTEEGRGKNRRVEIWIQR